MTRVHAEQLDPIIIHLLHPATAAAEVTVCTRSRRLGSPSLTWTRPVPSDPRHGVTARL